MSSRHLHFTGSDVLNCSEGNCIPTVVVPSRLCSQLSANERYIEFLSPKLYSVLWAQVIVVGVVVVVVVVVVVAAAAATVAAVVIPLLLSLLAPSSVTAPTGLISCRCITGRSIAKSMCFFPHLSLSLSLSLSPCCCHSLKMTYPFVSLSMIFLSISVSPFLCLSLLLWKSATENSSCPVSPFVHA